MAWSPIYLSMRLLSVVDEQKDEHDEDHNYDERKEDEENRPIAILPPILEGDYHDDHDDIDPPPSGRVPRRFIPIQFLDSSSVTPRRNLLEEFEEVEEVD